jgi:hypothetical protein
MTTSNLTSTYQQQLNRIDEINNLLEQDLTSEELEALYPLIRERNILIEETEIYENQHEQEEEDEEEGVWVAITNHPNFEIYNQYPYQIRNREKHNRLIKINMNKTLGYNICYLTNDRQCYHHRIIASQFIPNPNNLPEVDHIDHNRLNNHLDNLRFVSYSDNCINKISNCGIVYEFVKFLPNDCFVVSNYGQHEFNNLHYSPENDKFYKHTGVEFRALPVLTQSNGRYLFVYVVDTHGHKTKIIIGKFKRLYNIV